MPIDKQVGVDLNHYRLEGHEHASGCPINEERQESHVADRPARKGDPIGITPNGDVIHAYLPPDKVIVSRCHDCAAERIFMVGEVEAPPESEVSDG